MNPLAAAPTPADRHGDTSNTSDTSDTPNPPTPRGARSAATRRGTAKASTVRSEARAEERSGPEGFDKMRLTGDRLIVRIPEDRERRSKTGLLIPATAAATHKRCIWSEVLLVGPETRGVRTGDLVLFIPQSGLEVEVDGEAFLLLRERDVQAVTSERADPHAGQYL